MDDPFMPGPPYETLLPRRLYKAPHDLVVDGETIPAGTIVSQQQMIDAGITVMTVGS